MAVILTPTKNFPAPRSWYQSPLGDDPVVIENTTKLLNDIIAQGKKPRFGLRGDEYPNIKPAPAAPPVAAPSYTPDAFTFLQRYGAMMPMDPVMVRSAITQKLLELSNDEDAKIALRAIELLGKHSDVGIFTERSEITVKHTNPDELEADIMARVKRLMDREIINVTPKLVAPKLKAKADAN